MAVATPFCGVNVPRSSVTFEMSQNNAEASVAAKTKVIKREVDIILSKKKKKLHRSRDVRIE